MYKIILAAAVLALSPSLASAGGGGGGKHSNGTVRVQNNNPNFDAALVAVNPSASLRQATTLEEFTARGGKLIEAGQHHEFRNIRAGQQTVLIAFVNQGDTLANVSFQERPVTVTRGQTATVNLQATGT